MASTPFDLSSPALRTKLGEVFLGAGGGEGAGDGEEPLVRSETMRVRRWSEELKYEKVESGSLSPTDMAAAVERRGQRRKRAAAAATVDRREEERGILWGCGDGGDELL